MPTPRKPVEVLELSRHYRVDRHSQRRHAPKSDRGIGDPPTCLGPDEAAAWWEFIANAPKGVLTSGDRLALKATCRLVAKSRRQGLTGSETSVLRRLLGDLGATPASRGRVLPAGAVAEPTGATNPWDLAGPGRA